MVAVAQDEPRDRAGGFGVQAGKHMAVGVHRDRDAGVPEPLGDDLGRDVGGKGGAGVAVPDVVTAEEPGFGAELYATLDRDQLPDSAVLASLGCGNPTAVAELHQGETVLDLGSGGGIDVLLSARRVGPRYDLKLWIGPLHEGATYPPA